MGWCASKSSILLSEPSKVCSGVGKAFAEFFLKSSYILATAKSINLAFFSVEMSWGLMVVEVCKDCTVDVGTISSIGTIGEYPSGHLKNEE